MVRTIYITIFVFLLGTTFLLAQTKINENNIVSDTTKTKPENPLAPAKAAFYSAVIPGLGQAYNKKYWKIPLVYGAIGTSVYFYISNNRKYHEYRDVYKRRLEGYPASTDEFYFLDNDRLIRGQKFYQKNRDLSAMLTVLFYILNIVDANVDAHLMQFNVNDKLTIKPDFTKDDYFATTNMNLKLSYKF